MNIIIKEGFNTQRIKSVLSLLTPNVRNIRLQVKWKQAVVHDSEPSAFWGPVYFRKGSLCSASSFRRISYSRFLSSRIEGRKQQVNENVKIQWPTISWGAVDVFVNCGEESVKERRDYCKESKQQLHPWLRLCFLFLFLEERGNYSWKTNQQGSFPRSVMYTDILFCPKLPATAGNTEESTSEKLRKTLQQRRTKLHRWICAAWNKTSDFQQRKNRFHQIKKYIGFMQC